MENEEKPFRQMLKVMRLLDCQPGRSFDPDSGPPISIIYFAHRGELEPPMALDLRDSKKLVLQLLGVLGSHDSSVAEQILATHFAGGKWPDGDDENAA